MFIKVDRPATQTVTSNAVMIDNVAGMGYGLVARAVAGSPIIEVESGWDAFVYIAGNFALGFAEAFGPEVLTILAVAATAEALSGDDDDDEEPPVVYTPGNYDRDHLLVTWGGLLPGDEIWSCSLKMADDDQSATVANAFMEQMSLPDFSAHFADKIRDFHTREATGIHPSCKLSFVKVSHIGVDGKVKQPLGTHVSETVLPNVSGGFSGINYPNQVSLVVTLETGYTRGAAARGRFYLPMPGFGVQADGRITAANAAGVASSAATLITDLGDLPGLDLPGSPNVAILSRKSGAAMTRRVTGVSVGRVYDTQRRRRNKLDENYSTAVADQGAL